MNKNEPDVSGYIGTGAAQKGKVRLQYFNTVVHVLFQDAKNRYYAGFCRIYLGRFKVPRPNRPGKQA
jgi:hypothetical protein